jgi:ParB family chromosome partitioning protein
MPKPTFTGNAILSNFNDIFANTASIVPNDVIVEIPIAELYPPEFHPFHVIDDEAMIRLAENIKRYGVREPGLARPRADGGYELISGNRRKRGCELAELPTMPVIVREMDDNSAAIAMVDSNFEQREKLLYSERAWAYRVKMEALNHNGVKADMHSVEVLVAQTGESKNQIFRLIRLTELVNDLLDRVDANKLSFTAAVELSYLSQIEQTAVSAAMDKHEVKPSLSQAQRLKRMKQADELTVELIDEILAKTKKPTGNETKGTTLFREFFPASYTQSQIESAIMQMLKERKNAG